MAKSLVSSGVAPSTAVSAVLILGVKLEPATRGSATHYSRPRREWLRSLNASGTCRFFGVA